LKYVFGRIEELVILIVFSLAMLQGTFLASIKFKGSVNFNFFPVLQPFGYLDAEKKLLECGLSFTFGSESSQLSESEVTTSSNVTFFAQVFLWSVSASQDAERSSVQFVAFVEFFFAPFICVVFISIHSYSVVFQSPKWCKPALFWWPFKPLI